MADLNGLNLEYYDTFDDYSLLPDGVYTCRIADSELKTTQRGDRYISFVYEIAEGDYKGRRAYDNLFLWSNNEQAKEIARRTLKSLAVATGYPNPNLIPDTSELHGGMFCVTIGRRQDKNDNTKEYQSFKNYSAVDGKKPAPAQPTTTSGATPWD